jgi:hypothetical protein
MSEHPNLPSAARLPIPEGPTELPPGGAVPSPLGVDDPNYHCVNCLYIEVAADPSQSFWACQNLCERE